MYDQGYNPEINENEAKAKAAALAINKNWNILYPVGPQNGSRQSAEGSGAQQSPEDFVSKLMDKAQEDNDVAVAKAEGKAIIKNNNINVVVYI